MQKTNYLLFILVLISFQQILVQSSQNTDYFDIGNDDDGELLEIGKVYGISLTEDILEFKEYRKLKIKEFKDTIIFNAQNQVKGSLTYKIKIGKKNLEPVKLQSHSTFPQVVFQYKKSELLNKDICGEKAEECLITIQVSTPFASISHYTYGTSYQFISLEVQDGINNYGQIYPSAKTQAQGYTLDSKKAVAQFTFSHTIKKGSQLSLNAMLGEFRKDRKFHLSYEPLEFYQINNHFTSNNLNKMQIIDHTEKICEEKECKYTFYLYVNGKPQKKQQQQEVEVMDAFFFNVLDIQHPDSHELITLKDNDYEVVRSHTRPYLNQVIIPYRLEYNKPTNIFAQCIISEHVNSNEQNENEEQEEQKELGTFTLTLKGHELARFEDDYQYNSFDVMHPQELSQEQKPIIVFFSDATKSQNYHMKFNTEDKADRVIEYTQDGEIEFNEQNYFAYIYYSFKEPKEADMLEGYKMELNFSNFLNEANKYVAGDLVLQIKPTESSENWVFPTSEDRFIPLESETQVIEEEFSPAQKAVLFKLTYNKERIGQDTVNLKVGIKMSEQLKENKPGPNLGILIGVVVLVIIIIVVIFALIMKYRHKKKLRERDTDVYTTISSEIPEQA